MSIKIIRNASGLLPLLALFICAPVPPLAAESTIYRCGPAGSQRFSQIPCEENSERVIVEDHPLFTEAVAPGSDSADAMEGGESAAGRRADAASKAQAFIEQLEKQRSEQLAELDRSIEELQSRAKKVDEADDPTGDANEAAISLASMQNTRQSIMSEYEAMISAARERIETP